MPILSMISHYVTPSKVAQIATALGMQSHVAEKALNGAVPGLLAALLAATESADGESSFARTLSDQDPSMLDVLGGLLDQDTASVAATGRDGLASILGDAQLEDFTAKVQTVSGVPTGAASSLVGLSGSLVLGALMKTSEEDDLDAPGVLSKLRGEAGDIAKALPMDFTESLRGAGFLAALDKQLTAPHLSEKTSSAGHRGASPRPARVPVKPGRPWWQLALAGLVVLGVLAWAMGLLGGDAPTDLTDAGSSPQVVDGTNIGAQLQSEMNGLNTTLASITDAATAEKALPSLTAVLETLDAVAFSAEDLPTEGKTALQSTVANALPALRDEVARLTSNSAIAGVAGPILQQILDRLQSLT